MPSSEAKANNRQEAGFDLVPVFAQQHPGKEVDAAGVGGAQHHGRHGGLELPGEQPFGLQGEQVQDSKSGY